MRQLIFLAILLAALGCGNEEGINPGSESLDFFTDARLSGEYPFAFSGNNVVFHRHYQKEEEEAIADDEYSEDFFLELEDPGENFSFSGEELKGLKTLFLYYCFCAYTNESQLIDGSIKGTKISSSKYELEVDLTYEYYYIDEVSKDTTNTQRQTVKYKGIHQRDAVPGSNTK